MYLQLQIQPVSQNHTYTHTNNICHLHHHKHQGLDSLIRSVSRVTAALANVSSVFQLFSFPVVCSGMIWKGFGFVAFFASVEASSVCIRLYCLICLWSVIRGLCSRLFCGHEAVKPARGLNKFISAASILRLCKAVIVQFSDPCAIYVRKDKVG